MGKTFKISKFMHMYDRQDDSVEFSAKGYLSGRTLTELTTSLNSATLAEGAGAVNQRSLKKVTFETTTARYGEMIDYTDEVELFSEDYIQMKYREELGELANSRMEDLIQRDMLSTPTVLRAGSATSMALMGATQADGSDDADYKVSYDLVRLAVRLAVRNRAKRQNSLINGTTKIDTKTVAASYFGIVGAEIKSDLETITRGTTYEKHYVYTPAHKYAAAGNLAEGEIGSLYEIRFIESESAVVYAQQGANVPAGYTGSLSYTGTIGTDAKFDVYPILIPTEGSFATVGLKGMDKITFYSKDPKQVENGNPYGTTGFFSYNFFYAGIILKPEALIKVLACATK